MVVEYSTSTGRTNKGVATTWLRDKQPGGSDEEPEYPRVPVYVRRSQFRLPNRPGTPVIMIGPGTGLAPFRGFIQVTKKLFSVIKYFISGESLAEESRQACWTNSSIFWLQKQRKGLHLPGGTGGVGD